MVAKEACPDKSQLQRMLDGTLPPQDQTPVGLHLESCPECQAAFEELAKRFNLVPDGDLHGGERPESALLAVIETLAHEGPDGLADADTSPGEELYTPFLRPSDNPEHLGRLGPYEIVGLIGRGGMGMVFKAHDPRLNRFVAIKVLAPQLAAQPAARKRFLREAQAAAAVSHDHIVTIHAVEEVDGFPYIVMEYVLGVSLAERIAQSGPLDLQANPADRRADRLGPGRGPCPRADPSRHQARNILLENGVEQGEDHRLRPGPRGRRSQVTRAGQIAGTPEYMSPEQARGQTLDHRSDLFSLGCVLYAMCSGRSPFHSQNAWDAIARVCNEPPPPLWDVNAETPDWLIEIIDKLLAKNAGDRFQSAAEVADILGQHLAQLQQPGAMAPQKRPAAGDGAARRTRPRFVARLGMVAATLLLLVGTLGATEATGVTHLSATVIRIFRPEGTLEIVVDDPGVKVAIDGEDIGIQGAGPHEVHLRLGSHQVQALSHGKPVYQDLVTINRGGKQIVKIGMAPPARSEAKGKVELVPNTVSIKSFRDGDSITITEVKATSPDLKDGDKVIVKGHYTLASQPKASLCLFATAKTGPGIGPVHPEQRIAITAGQGEFELSETLDGDGYLHVTFYSVPEDKGFGGVYFGTAKQMEEIKPWHVENWYVVSPDGPGNAEKRDAARARPRRRPKRRRRASRE